MRRRSFLLAVAASVPLFVGRGCATTRTMDLWRAPGGAQAVPTRAEAVVLLPTAVQAPVSPEGVRRVFEDGLRGQLEHATTVLGGASFAGPLQEAGLGPRRLRPGQ